MQSRKYIRNFKIQIEIVTRRLGVCAWLGGGHLENITIVTMYRKRLIVPENCIQDEPSGFSLAGTGAELSQKCAIVIFFKMTLIELEEKGQKRPDF